MSHSQPFQQLVPSIPLGIGKADVLSNGVEAYRAPAQRRRDQRVPRLDGRAVALLRNRKFADSSLEGSGFELPVPQCALSSPTERPWSRPPDLAVSGGALNGHLTTPIGGRPATLRLTRREDRSAQLGRGPEDLGNRVAANYRFPNRLSLICRLSGPLEPSYEV